MIKWILTKLLGSYENRILALQIMHEAVQRRYWDANKPTQLVAFFEEVDDSLLKEREREPFIKLHYESYLKTGFNRGINHRKI